MHMVVGLKNKLKLCINCSCKIRAFFNDDTPSDTLKNAPKPLVFGIVDFFYQTLL